MRCFLLLAPNPLGRSNFFESHRSGKKGQLCPWWRTLKLKTSRRAPYKVPSSLKLLALPCPPKPAPLLIGPPTVPGEGGSLQFLPTTKQGGRRSGIIAVSNF